MCAAQCYSSFHPWYGAQLAEKAPGRNHVEPFVPAGPCHAFEPPGVALNEANLRRVMQIRTWFD